MPTVLLVRHGRTAANAAGVLAGRSTTVDLDDTGRRQAEALAGRLAEVPLARVVTSPQTRCQQTAAALVAGPTGRPGTGARHPDPLVEAGLDECDYGDWTGRALKDLAEDPLWKVVQAHPSAAAFPAGESMTGMQARAIEAVRRHDAQVGAEHGQDAVWVAVSHGDVIKSVLADALGTHLDAFQRIVVDPCSVSVIRFTPLRPFVLRTNDTDGSLRSLVPDPETSAVTHSDAVVGGGAG